MASNTDKQSAGNPATSEANGPKENGLGARFWVIFLALWIVGFQVSLESTIVVTAMPSIVRELRIGDNYVWVINASFLTITATIPLYAQMADLFGRRSVMLLAIAIFLLGTGICGGASSSAMLIGGRAVMGAGGGGMTMLIDIIVSDMVPLKKRPLFMGLIFFAINLGTALGPFVGGQVVATTTWRWIFWLNMPITGLAAVMLFVFLRTPWRRTGTALEALAKVDVIGNAVLITSTISILFGLTFAGTRHPWTDWRILLPLFLGLAGLGLFFALQSIPRICPHPIIPLRLFATRTSTVAYILTFVYMMLSYWRLYFLPVYFQSAMQSSPARAGIQLLPSVLMLFPSVLISGVFVKKFGRFLPMHYVGFGILLVGHGLLTLLDQHTSTAGWVLVQMVVAFGSGLIITALLPAIQASVSEADTAAAVGAWGLVRAFGVIWGISIPAAIFNTRFGALAGKIADPAVRVHFVNGNAYGQANAHFIGSFGADTTAQIIDVYASAIRQTWQVAVAFAGFAFLLVLLEKNLTLRESLDTRYGLQEQMKDVERSSGSNSDNKEIPRDLIDPVPAGGHLRLPSRQVRFDVVFSE